MKIAVFGSGNVGETIGSKLVSLGHEVKMGSRAANNEAGAAWVKKAGAKASQGTFADAAAFGEVVFVCVAGAGAVPAVEAAGAALDGKVVVDITNPLDFSKGFPPSLTVANTDSLSEQLQRAAPKAKVVKTLNTVNCQLMVDAKSLKGGEHTMFLCGNDAGAKERVVGEFLKPFGWTDVIDLGGLDMARATEAYVLLWARLYGTLKTPSFNVKVVR
jgi:predicted dinucleotide-binding enzyme